jgi:hypothetical protein
MEIKKCVEDTLDSMRRIKNVLSSREDYRLADLFENPDFLSVEANKLTLALSYCDSKVIA